MCTRRQRLGPGAPGPPPAPCQGGRCRLAASATPPVLNPVEMEPQAGPLSHSARAPSVALCPCKHTACQRVAASGPWRAHGWTGAGSVTQGCWLPRDAQSSADSPSHRYQWAAPAEGPLALVVWGRGAGDTACPPASWSPAGSGLDHGPAFAPGSEPTKYTHRGQDKGRTPGSNPTSGSQAVQS